MDRYQLFVQLLEEWFEDNKRLFPWRKNRTPYYVWVSEVMSHQTQIERVAEKFFPRFIKKFPNIQSLAKADWEKDIYPTWEGLGYYNRARHMHQTAKIIVEKYQGKFPQNIKVLETLPGIGKYTACAICSFAFNQKVPAIDTNITKILSILWPKEKTVNLAQKLVQLSSSSYAWNSAMMDLASKLRKQEKIEGKLGEIFFPPAVIKKFAPQKKSPSVSPPKKSTSPNTSKKKERIIEVGIACIWKDGKYLIQSRPKGKSFVGFWEFPGGKREKGESFRECVKREIKEEIGVHVSVRPHFLETIHVFPDSATKLKLRFHRCQIQSGTPQPLEGQKIEWIKPEDFHKKKFLKTNALALKKLQKMKV